MSAVRAKNVLENSGCWSTRKVLVFIVLTKMLIFTKKKKKKCILDLKKCVVEEDKDCIEAGIEHICEI